MANQNPKDQAGFLSAIFYFWLYGLIKLASQRQLNDDDLFGLSESDEAEAIVEHFKKLWNEEVKHAKKKGRNPRLWKAISRSISFSEYLSLVTLIFLEWFLSWSSVVFLWIFQKLAFEDPKTNPSYISIGAMAGICISSLTIRPIVTNHNFYNICLVGMRLKIACIGIIYKKVLASSRSSISRITAGQILNLLSSDAQRMEKIFLYVKYYLMFFLDFPVTIVLLTVLAGWQSLSGAFLILIITFLNNSFVSNRFGKLRIKQARVTDQRLATLNDIIKGIRTVKMYALERNYRDKVKELRRKEISILRLKSLILTISQVLLLSFSFIATLTSVVTMVYLDIPVNAVNMFTVTLILSNLNRSTSLLAMGVTGISDSLASITRMEKYLLDTDQRESDGENTLRDTVQAIFQGLRNCFKKNKKGCKEKPTESILNNSRQTVNKPDRSEYETETIVKLSQVCSGWLENSSQCALEDISLNVLPSQLLMVTGPVGSGKTTLLMTILRQIPLKSGTISTEGRIAYASQIPWIFTGTVRDNILFGKKYDEKRYQRVLEVCDLVKDVNRFSKGDLSMIGQRGVSLSGGQRARVGLARAVYSDAEILLLDDPLSAVDAKVGKHIFDKCICEELSGKIRILVTHQLQHLHRADEIVVLKDGRIVDRGPYEHISEDTSLGQMLEDYKSADIKGVAGTDQGEALPFKDDLDERLGRDMTEEDEDKRAGTVSWRLYWDYLRIGLPAPVVVLVLTFFLVAQGAVIVPVWWQKVIANMSYSKQRNPTTLGVYAAIVAGSCVIVSARIVFLFFTFLKSSERVHDRMTTAILKSPALFFDTNPAGRIMNRFSKDIGALDDLLPMQFIISISCFLYFLGIVCLTGIANIWFIIAIIPTLAVFIILGSLYLKIVRQLSRIETKRCSPIYEHFGETIAGLEVINTSEMDDSSLQKYYRFQNLHTRAFSLLTSTHQMFGLYIDLLFGLFVTAIATGCVILSLDAATTGLLLSYGMTVKSITSVALRYASEAETQMISVERVIAYTQLTPEPGYDRQFEIKDNWPSQGALSLRGVSLAYFKKGSLILKNVDLDVQPREKVGIAGRTGAGKSSLVAALFRMPDPQGQVLVDGIDLGQINVQDARRCMAVITQEPVLFEGSLLKNLDPFDQFTEDEIWTALKEVQLMECVKNLDGRLHYSFGEGGSGFSVGERQLLCLARALLQRRKILILDEATANVDYRTDQLIQQVIRDKFSDCTVLTIAHRLNTIIDYDRVVVLDGGRIVEDDSPGILATKSDGVFAHLLRNNGYEFP